MSPLIGGLSLSGLYPGSPTFHDRNQTGYGLFSLLVECVDSFTLGGCYRLVWVRFNILRFIKTFDRERVRM